MDKDKLKDKYHTKWGKHTSSPTLRFWNYYQQYYQQNLKQECAQLPSLPLDTKGYIGKCYEQFKADMGEDGGNVSDVLREKSPRKGGNQSQIPS